MNTPADYRRAAYEFEASAATLRTRRNDLWRKQHNPAAIERLDVEIDLLLDRAHRLHRKALLAALRPWLVVALALLAALIIFGGLPL